MIKRILLVITSVTAAMAVPSTLKAESNDGFAFDAAVTWESRYVTEGINNVPGSSFIATEAVVSRHGFGLGAWWTEAFSDSYNEVNMFADYTHAIGTVEVTLGLNRLEFPAGDDPSTWEVYGGVLWEAVEQVELFVETYYDFDDVRGGFMEAGFAFEPAIPSPGDRLGVTLYGLTGFDYGFVSDPRRLQENNVQVGLTGSWSLHKNVDLIAHVNHSVALTNLDREGEGDVTWGGAGLAASF